MLIPIRCFSCGKPIAHLWEEYQQRVKKGENPKEVLDDLGLVRYCCRGVMLSTVELIDLPNKFKRS